MAFGLLATLACSLASAQRHRLHRAMHRRVRMALVRAHAFFPMRPRTVWRDRVCALADRPGRPPRFPPEGARVMARLEDTRVPVRLRLAGLWTSLMFCY